MPETTPYDDIIERLDVGHIEQVAQTAAGELIAWGRVRVELTPGDATRYPIGIIGPSVVIAKASRYERDYLVALQMAGGRAYPWGPENSDYTDPTYAQEKWSPRELHTGVVMSLFLNALRKELAS